MMLQLLTMTKKRYQYYSKDGIVWSNWFKPVSDLKEKWQLKNKLLNDYEEDLRINSR